MYIWLKAPVLIWSSTVKQSCVVLKWMTTWETRCYTIFSHRQIVNWAAFLCSCLLCIRILQLLLLHTLMVVCAGASSIATTGMMVPIRVQQQIWLSKLRFCHHHWCWGTQEVLLASPLSCSSCLSPRCLFRHIPTMPWVLCRSVFSFRVSLPLICLYMLVSIMVYAFYFQVPMWMPFSPMEGWTIGICTISAPQSILMADICASWLRSEAPTKNALSGCSFHCFKWGYGWAYSLGGLAVTQSLCLPSMVLRDLLFQIWFYPMTHSTPNQWWVWNLMILVWWLVSGWWVYSNLVSRAFIAWSHIYSDSIGKVAWLIPFQLKPGCEDYSFLEQICADFEQGLNSILTDFIKTPEPDVATSLVPSGFLCSVSTISDTSEPQPPPNINSDKLWFQARSLLLPVSLTDKMSAFKLIWYFSSHPAVFWFQYSSLPESSLESCKYNWSNNSWFSDWHWCGCSYHSWYRAADFSCQNCSCWYHCLFPGFWLGMIPVQEVLESLTKIHGILDNSVSK